MHDPVAWLVGAGLAACMAAHAIHDRRHPPPPPTPGASDICGAPAEEDGRCADHFRIM